MDERLRLRAFVSSPGDVSEERALAEQVLKRLGEEYRDWVELGIVLWEHEPLFVHAGFQEQIPRPSHCDLVVTVLWSRLGTRLPANFALTPGAPAPTGTEFEVRDALEARKRSGKPDLLLYRKMAAPLVNLKSAGAEDYLRQYRMLNEFCGRVLVDEPGKLAAHFEFREGWEFERMLSEHTRKWLESKIGHSEAKPRWTIGSPYRGLEVFEAQHRKIYFGRSQAVSELIKRLREGEALASESQVVTRFLLLQGMSGSGKSSLIRAGLLPLLEGRALEGIGAWRQVILKPSDQPSSTNTYGALGVLAERLLAALPHLAESYTEATLADRLRAAPTEIAALLDSYLSEEAGRLSLRVHQIRLVLVVDQLEECWGPAMPEIERRALAMCLAAMAREGRIWIVATLRSDFIPHLEASSEYLALLRDGQLYVLSTPRPDELAQMIRAPAEAAGLAWEVKEGVSLDQAVLREATSSPESLPLLEYALDQLYEHREGRTLTYAAYDRLGRLAGGIAASAEAILREQGQPAEHALPRLLRSLVSVDESGQATRRYAPLGDLSEGTSERALLDRLISRRLCVTDKLADRAVVCLAHDSLLRSWPRLTDWLQHEQSLLQTRDLVERETRLWQQNGESDAWLAAADKLPAFNALSSAEIVLPGPVGDFLARSARRARRSAQLKQIAVGLIAVLAVAASVGAWVATMRQREAEHQTRLTVDAQKRSLTEVAAARLKGGDLPYARRVMTEVLRNGDASSPPDPSAVNVFQEVRARDPLRLVIGGGVTSAAYSPDGERILMSFVDGSLRLCDAHTGTEIAEIAREKRGSPRAHYSTDGTRIVATTDHDIRILDARTGTPLQVLADSSKDQGTARFSPDGTRLIAPAGKAVRIWNAYTGIPVRTMSGQSAEVRGAGYSPDGAFIYAALGDNTVRILDARSGAPLARLAGHTAELAAVAFSPDGTKVVTAALDGTARIWETRTGAILHVLAPNTAQMFSAAFSPDGKTVATGSTDKLVRLWDVATGAELKVIAGHRGVIWTVVFSPDGSHLLSSAADDTARVWDLRSGPATVILGGSEHPAQVNDFAYSRDGSIIATTSSDGLLRLWDASTGQLDTVVHYRHDASGEVLYSPDGTRILTTTGGNRATLLDARSFRQVSELSSPEDVAGVAFSPDSRRIAARHDGNSLGIWDADTGLPLFVWRGHPDVTSVSYSPDGQRLVTTSLDNTARIWDARAGTQIAVLPQADFMYSAVYSPDGGRILTSSLDETARIWSARDGAPLMTMSGHRSPLFDARFSTDGTRVATASRDYAVRVWDAQSGNQLAVLLGHTDRVGKVAYSPDGKHLASAARDQSVRIWHPQAIAGLAEQILWAQAAEPDPLSEVELRGLGLLLVNTDSARSVPGSACDREAAAFYDPDRRAQGVVQAKINVDLAVGACLHPQSAASNAPPVMYETGRVLLQKGDIDEAMRHFTQALAKGYRAAGVDLAMLLTNPAAQRLDPQRAVSLYEMAWQQGVSIAAFRLGEMYEHGIPGRDGAQGLLFQPDAVKAWVWYQKGAEAEEPHALGRMAQREEGNALSAVARAEGNARLLKACELYALASERAQKEGWPDEAWRVWRYRRASLARMLAQEHLMREVAQAYQAVRAESGTRTPSWVTHLLRAPP